MKTYLDIGSFVLITKDGQLRVAQILHRSRMQVEVNLYVEIEETRLHSTVPFLTGIAMDCREVVQTSERITVSRGSVKDLSFVFSISELEQHGYIIQGQANAYVCRYRINGNLKGQSYCFPSRAPDGPSVPCYPSRIWLSLEHIRTILQRALNKRGEKQIGRMMERLYLPFEVWQYIKLQVGPFKSVFRETTVKVKRTIGGMRRASYFQKTDSELLRFLTEEHLEVFRSIFNSHSTHGIRARYPRKKERPLRLADNAVFNWSSDLYLRQNKASVSIHPKMELI